MNQVQLFGRLTRDPELRYTQSGKAVVSFTLAINRIGGNNEQTDFFDCTAWEKQAELIANSCHKGHRLLVWGRLQQEKWTDQQTQQQRSKVAVVALGFSFIEPAPQNQQQPPAGPPAQYGQPPSYGQQPPGYGPPTGYIPPNPGAYPPPGQYGQPPAGPPQGHYAAPPAGPPQQGQRPPAVPPQQGQYGQPAGAPPQGGYTGNLNDIPF